MKTHITITLSLVLAAAVRAQTLSDYQSVISGQSPYYYNTLDSATALAPTDGAGTFSATAGVSYTSDYFGNADSAAAFATSTAQLSLSAGNNIISGSGTATPSGSMSLLFETPDADLSGTTGQYIFSNGDTTAGATAGTGEFALEMTGGALVLKVVNKSYTIIPALSGGEWYYFGATWNLNGTAAGVNGLTYYVGVAGGPITSVFLQKGGTGNFNSTDNFGNGESFVLSGKQAGNGGFEVGNNPGSIDELATWDSQLTGDQMASQYNALALAVPEPSSVALGGAGGLLALLGIRKFAGDKKTNRV